MGNSTFIISAGSATMWGRILTASSLTGVAVQDVQDQDRHLGDVHKRSMAREPTCVVRSDGAHWAELDSNNIPPSLKGLGISHTATHTRFAVHGGRIVPLRHEHSDVVLPSQRKGSRAARYNRIFSRRNSRVRRQYNPALRPASSIYSQASQEPSSPLSTPPAPIKLAISSGFGGLSAEQISPPSSPESKSTRYRWKSGDVSPIDDDFDSNGRRGPRDDRRDTLTLPSQQQRFYSRPKSSGSECQAEDVVTSTSSESQTLSKREWYQQIRTSQDSGPYEYQTSPSEGSFGVVTEVTSSVDERMTSPSLGQRMRLMSKLRSEPNHGQSLRNAASEQSIAASPTRDGYSVAPLSLPQKSSEKPSRGGRLLAPSFGSETTGSHAGRNAMRRLLPLASRHKARKQSSPSPQVTIAQRSPAIEDSYPSPPYDDSPSPTTDSYKLVLQSQALSSNPPDPVYFSHNRIKRKPPPASASVSPVSTILQLSSLPNGADGFAAPVPWDPPAHADGGWVPPPSRFSITTYATSNAETPRPSEDEDIPALPPLPPPTSVMDRSRPVAGGRSRRPNSAEPIIIDMSSPYILVTDSHRIQKDHAAAQGHEPRHWSVNDATDTISTDRRASTSSISKPLPLAPPEMSSSKDTVSTLRAQINGLIHRRFNIERSIKQMTMLMPQDNLLASNEVVRRREAEKRKVENLREELSEIQRLEHDLGLKLHRAYKRQDRDAEYELTSLWVRRVAG